MGLCCINNPGYRGFLLGQLEELQSNYDTDGFWMDIYHYDSLCFCRHCRTKFARDTAGKTLEAQQNTDELKLWWRDSFLELFQDIKKIASYDGKERVVTYNFAGGGRYFGYRTIDQECNTLTAEAHTASSKSYASRLLGHAQIPFEIYTPVSIGVDSWTFRPANLIHLETAVVAAHGGSCLAGFDVKPNGSFSSSQMNVLGKIGKNIRDRQPYLTGVEPVHDVGLLLYREGAGVEKLRKEGGWANALLRNQIPFAVLTELSGVARYQLVIVDEEFPMDDVIARQLEEYVSQGGNLLVVQNAAGVADEGRNSLLSELLGIECLELTGFDTVYIGNIDQRIYRAETIDAVRADGDSWRIKTTTAESLANIVYPIAQWSRERFLWTGPNPPSTSVSEDPAITINRFGKGRAVFFACGMEQAKHPDRAAMRNLHRRELVRLGTALSSYLIAEPLIKSAVPSAVEIVVNSQRDRHIVHFLNHCAEMSCFYDEPDRIPVLSNVSVWVNQNRIGKVEKILRIPENREVDIVTDGQWLGLSVEDLGIHEMFSLER